MNETNSSAKIIFDVLKQHRQRLDVEYISDASKLAGRQAAYDERLKIEQEEQTLGSMFNRGPNDRDREHVAWLHKKRAAFIAAMDWFVEKFMDPNDDEQS